MFYNPTDSLHELHSSNRSISMIYAKKNLYFIGVWQMSRFVFSYFTQKIFHHTKSALLACALLGTTQFAVAGQAVDQLSECLVKSTTAADKTTVLQWTFTALAQHPELKTFSQVTPEQKTALDKSLAQTLQRILTEQCSTQAQAVIKAEGLEAVGNSFQELGSITGEEILKTPEIKQQLNGVLKYIDLNKLVMTFLTPDIWNKLGVVREQ